MFFLLHLLAKQCFRGKGKKIDGINSTDVFTDVFTDVLMCLSASGNVAHAARGINKALSAAPAACAGENLPSRHN